MFATQANNKATEAKISTDKNTAKYLGPVLEVVAWMMKPIAPVIAAVAQNGPRILKWSDRNVMPIIKKKHNRYGGADRPFDVALLKEPISSIIVGTKSGSDAKETLQLKYMRAGMYDFGSLRPSSISLILTPWLCPTSSR